MVYKFYYFACRAVGEPIRQLFKLAAKEFENIRITPQEWEKYKSQMPFGQIPVLELDNGVKLAQSAAIARFLAVEFGLAGKTPMEMAKVDEIVDLYKDYYIRIKDFYYCTIGLLPGNAVEMYVEIFVPAAEQFFTLLTKVLKDNVSGFLVGDSATFADLLIADHLTTINNYYPQYFVDHPWPEIKAHKEKVESIPQIKKWIEERPDDKE